MAFRPYLVFFPGKAPSEIYPLIKENLTKKTFYENQRKAKKKNKENRELFLERKSEKRKRNYFIELNKFRCG